MGRGIYLSVVIPAYNEEAVVETTLTRASNFLNTQDYKWEVIVVDDASTDSTANKVNQILANQPNIRLLVNERNRNRTGRYELVCGEGRFRDQEGEPAMVFMEDLEERSRSGSGQDS